MSVTRLRLLPASVVALGAALGVSVLLLGQTGGTTSKAGAAGAIIVLLAAFLLRPRTSALTASQYFAL